MEGGGGSSTIRVCVPAAGAFRPGGAVGGRGAGPPAHLPVALLRDDLGRQVLGRAAQRVGARAGQHLLHETKVRHLRRGCGVGRGAAMAAGKDGQGQGRRGRGNGGRQRGTRKSQREYLTRGGQPCPPSTLRYPSSPISRFSGLRSLRCSGRVRVGRVRGAWGACLEANQRALSLGCRRIPWETLPSRPPVHEVAAVQRLERQHHGGGVEARVGLGQR
jgi:hypothetical protein